MMKIEITYEIREVTRYQIFRSDKSEGGGRFTSGFSCVPLGEFERRDDAEKVRDALDAAAYRSACKGL